MLGHRAEAIARAYLKYHRRNTTRVIYRIKIEKKIPAMTITTTATIAPAIFFLVKIPVGIL